MIGELKKLSKKELQNEFKKYLQQNNYARNSIRTYSSQALFLFEKLGNNEFWNMLESENFETLARQWIYNELMKNRTQKYTSGYLSNLRCFREFCGIASGYNEKGKFEHSKSIRCNYTEKKYEPTLDVLEVRNAIKKFHYSVNDNYTRYRSWEHCYNAFKTYRHDNDKIEFLCMHLSCFMASWGMLRNSKLMDYDYLIHEDFIKQISDIKFDRLYDENYFDIDLVMELVDLINQSYLNKISSTDKLSDTFITKILLGIFGCVPAYDTYFCKAVRKFHICSGSFNRNSLNHLYSYYQMYSKEFNELKKQFSEEGVYYTPMKLIDMCFWQIGNDM